MNCGHCCEDMVIDAKHLIFPGQMDAAGQEFVRAHGLDYVALGDLRRAATVEPNGHIKIRHRCQWLTDDQLCAIYETRPKICRDFDCSTRPDCCRHHADLEGPHDDDRLCDERQ